MEKSPKKKVTVKKAGQPKLRKRVTQKSSDLQTPILDGAMAEPMITVEKLSTATSLLGAKAPTRRRRVAARKRTSGVTRSRVTRATVTRRTAMDRFWFSAVGGAILLLGAGLWYYQKPLETPSAVVLSAPVVSHAPAPAPASPVAAAPVISVAPVLPVARPERAVHPLDQVFKQSSLLSMDERVVFWSEYVWKKWDGPQKLKILGQGPEVDDSVPLLPKKFDCTTFVETVAALARSHAPEDFYGQLLAIRYRGGRAAFLDRNHFPEADWIPNNQKAGIIQDLTAVAAKQAGVVAHFESKVIDRGKWLSQELSLGRVNRRIASEAQSDWQKPVTTQVPYVALEDLERVAEKIPSGAVLNFVRNDDVSHPVLISHQGFLVREGGLLLLRHASSGGNIRTVNLREYIETQKKNQAPGWRLIGFNFNRLNG